MTVLKAAVHAEDHVRGAHNAPAMLVGCGDYECPYTRRAYRVVQKLPDEMSDQLSFVYRHFPLTSIHPRAEHAAEAAEAAAAHGMFWEMHDTLFAHQHTLDDAGLRRYADDLELIAEQFEENLHTRTDAHRIADDARSGLASGVQRTPAPFFNGLLHPGGYDEETMCAAIAHATAGGQQAP